MLTKESKEVTPDCILVRVRNQIFAKLYYKIILDVNRLASDKDNDWTFCQKTRISLVQNNILFLHFSNIDATMNSQG